MNSSTTLLMEFTLVSKSNANYTWQIFVAAVEGNRGEEGIGYEVKWFNAKTMVADARMDLNADPLHSPQKL